MGVENRNVGGKPPRGADLHEICGIDPLGIAATSDFDEILALDADCDGVASAVDCDDGDPGITNTNLADADCDLVPTAVDCDDTDPSLGDIAFDADCADDKDCDGDLNTTDTDDDDDGVVDTDDCDPLDAANTSLISLDGDCDGALTGDDCDDGDPALGASASDADCDGVITQSD